MIRQMSEKHDCKIYEADHEQSPTEPREFSHDTSFFGNNGGAAKKAIKLETQEKRSPLGLF
jgi:hypothetical protein